jgi:hypothetical protein
VATNLYALTAVSIICFVLSAYWIIERVIKANKRNNLYLFLALAVISIGVGTVFSIFDIHFSSPRLKWQTEEVSLAGFSIQLPVGVRNGDVSNGINVISTELENQSSSFAVFYQILREPPTKKETADSEKELRSRIEKSGYKTGSITELSGFHVSSQTSYGIRSWKGFPSDQEVLYFVNFTDKAKIILTCTKSQFAPYGNVKIFFQSFLRLK